MGLAACSPSSVPAAESKEVYLIELAERLDSVDALYLSDRVVDSLPNVTYLLDDGTSTTESDSVVIGTIEEVRDVTGFTLDGEDVRESSADEAPMWHLADVEVEVEEAWGSHAGETTAHIVLPLSSSRSLEESVRSIESLGRVVLILNGTRVVHNEEYLGLVESDETIRYPLISDSSEVEGVGSLAELRDALAQEHEPRAGDLLGAG